MRDVNARSHDDIMQARRMGYVADQFDDWDLVLREAHHRMKNTLMLLAGSVRREFKKAGAGELSAAVDRFERRIVAFGQLYHLLSGDEDVEAVSVASFFERLCEALSKTILEPSGIRCVVSIEDGTLFATQCQRLGLIVTELVTNAAKHAFPGEVAGLIRVEALHRNSCWYVTVMDNGTGASGPQQGTGGRILAGLADSIRAKLHHRSDRDGTCVTIAVPALI